MSFKFADERQFLRNLRIWKGSYFSSHFFLNGVFSGCEKTRVTSVVKNEHKTSWMLKAKRCPKQRRWEYFLVKTKRRRGQNNTWSVIPRRTRKPGKEGCAALRVRLSLSFKKLFTKTREPRGWDDVRTWKYEELYRTCTSQTGVIAKFESTKDWYGFLSTDLVVNINSEDWEILCVREYSSMICFYFSVKLFYYFVCLLLLE